MRQRGAGVPGGPEPALLHPVVVAEQTAGLPTYALEQGLRQFVGAAQPSPRHVDPRALIEADALDQDTGIDVDGVDGSVVDRLRHFSSMPHRSGTVAAC